MISVEEAKRIMMAHVPSTAKGSVLLAGGASERFIAEDVHAPCDHPLFDMSAVDGYAFMFTGEEKEWNVKGSIAAGDVFVGRLERGECARIFTGAMMPEGADTVVMQEHATLVDGRMSHTDQRLKRGGNVRRQGEQARKGDPLLQRGDRLDAATVGLLASFGVTRMKVAERPRVAVVTTGDEVVTTGDPGPGRIFNSNGVMLHAALREHAAEVRIEHAPDDAGALRLVLERARAMSGVVVITGGASVGEHDLVEAVLLGLGATIHFHGVAQKPGKPMLFATLNNKPMFGLPGNPRAVMVLFWEYVLPFLCAMQGARDPWLKSERLPVAHGIHVKGERAEFRAAQVREGRVTLLADEGSHMLRSLVDADALAYLPAGQREWKSGETVEIHYLPQ